MCQKLNIQTGFFWSSNFIIEKKKKNSDITLTILLHENSSHRMTHRRHFVLQTSELIVFECSNEDDG